MSLNSHWIDSATLPTYPKLQQSLDVDVIIVGGGITGITAAYLLKKAGKSVALLERARCCRAETGHTTAHVTYVTDTRLSELASTFGKPHAQAAWDAGRAAQNQIHANVINEQINCGYSVVPGYLHASWHPSKEDEKPSLRKDADLAAELGFDAQYLDLVPFVNRPGIRFENQAKFHPLRYLAGLLAVVQGGGCHIFEETEVTEFQSEPLAVKANGHTVRGKYLIVATHVPAMGVTGFLASTLLQTKLAAYSTFAVGAKIPPGSVPEAEFWDTSDPYYYLRIDRFPTYDYAILGGEDYKTGQKSDNQARIQRLEEMLVRIVPGATVDARWTGQVVETPDGLPYIGEIAERQFVATGFAGNGMTFGTLSAMMAADAVQGIKNPWRDLFDVNRKKLSTVWDYVKENVDYPYYYLKDKLLGGAGKSLNELNRGEGKILKLNGQRVAAYRNDQGEVTTLSPVCTHMGCIVHWNQADTTWDCPCHGSRFKATGEVHAGPADKSLEPISVDMEKK